VGDVCLPRRSLGVGGRQKPGSTCVSHVEFAVPSNALLYPLRFAGEGGHEKYESFFQQFNDRMHS
jgi:hypothetical protein